MDVPRKPALSRRFVDNVTRGGGVILYFRDHFVVKKIDVVIRLKSFEYACLSISTPRGPVTVVVIYRPGSLEPDATFLQEFSSLLEVLATFNSRFVIGGDLNIHFEDQTNNAVVQVNQILSSFALTQHVVLPTHNRGGILDVIITDRTVASLIFGSILRLSPTMVQFSVRYHSLFLLHLSLPLDRFVAGKS